MPKKRIAIIGLGMASKPHALSLRDLADRVEVAAVYSPTPARRDAFARAYGFAPADDAQSIFDDAGIDVLLVLTPPNTHLDIVRRAAEAKKHVLLEKPLEVTPERARQLVETAEEAGITLGVVLQHRFRPVSVELAGIVAQGRLGELVGASAHLWNWRPQSYYEEPGRGTLARDGGGVLLTQGIHTLDLLVSLTGLPQEISAHAATSPVHRMECEDIATATMRYGNGALGTVFATTAAYPGFPDMIELIGTKGTARIDGSTLLARFPDGSETRLDDGALGGGAGADPMAFPHQHHRAVIADFLDALDEGRQPKASGRDALKVHRLIDVMLLAARSGARERLQA